MSSKRRRAFIVVAAHIVLLGLTFQIGAFDHWHPQMEDIRGVEGTDFHAAHCHGLSASCADGGGTGFAYGDAPAPIPVPPPPRRTLEPEEQIAPRSALSLELLHPPRFA